MNFADVLKIGLTVAILAGCVHGFIINVEDTAFYQNDGAVDRESLLHDATTNDIQSDLSNEVLWLKPHDRVRRESHWKPSENIGGSNGFELLSWADSICDDLGIESSGLRWLVKIVLVILVFLIIFLVFAVIFWFCRTVLGWSCGCRRN